MGTLNLVHKTSIHTNLEPITQLVTRSFLNFITLLCLLHEKIK